MTLIKAPPEINAFGYGCLTRVASMTHLPTLNRIDGVNQHKYFQQETIPNPNKQHSFNRQEYNYGPLPTQLSRNHESNRTAEDVA